MDRPPLRKLLVHYIAPRYPIKPTSLFISPTLRCSSRCSHCLIWAEGGRNKKELDPAEWGRILADPFFCAIHTLWFSGGEPTLRGDLHKIAIAAASALPSLESITIASNALDSEAIEENLRKLAPRLRERGIYLHLHLSMDGPPNIHDRIRGIEGAYSSLERAVAAARRLREDSASIGWSFNCVIQEDNVDYLTQIIDAAKLLESNITFNVAERMESFYRSREGRGIGESERQKAVKFVEGLIEDSDPYHRRHYETVRAVLNGESRPHKCETLDATMYLDPDASIFPCPRAYHAVDIKLTETPPSEGWKLVFSQRARIRRELCPTCSLGCSFGEGLSLVEYARLIFGAR